MRVLIVARPNVSFSLRAGKPLMIRSYWSKASNASARPSVSNSAAMTFKMLEEVELIQSANSRPKVKRLWVVNMFINNVSESARVYYPKKLNLAQVCSQDSDSRNARKILKVSLRRQRLSVLVTKISLFVLSTSSCP